MILDEWAIHFDPCVEINGWDNAAKLRFFRVCLMGRAQSILQHLPRDKKDTFDHAESALHQRFEPSSKQADDLRWLAAKAYPDLAVSATDQLALTHNLMGISIWCSISTASRSHQNHKRKQSAIQVESYLAFNYGYDSIITSVELTAGASA